MKRVLKKTRTELNEIPNKEMKADFIEVIDSVETLYEDIVEGNMQKSHLKQTSSLFKRLTVRYTSYNIAWNGHSLLEILGLLIEKAVSPASCSFYEQ